jgi:hypothetical protein
LHADEEPTRGAQEALFLGNHPLMAVCAFLYYLDQTLLDNTPLCGNSPFTACHDLHRTLFFHPYRVRFRGVPHKRQPEPTNQNNIQKDIEALPPLILDQPEADIRHALEMLVRAYDLCVCCSTR